MKNKNNQNSFLTTLRTECYRFVALLLLCLGFSSLTQADIISTFAGTGTAGYSGDSGAATSANLNYPTGVAVDSNGAVYIVDNFNNRIRKVDSSGNISTIAGTGTQGYSGDGNLAINAQLNRPTGVAVDNDGVVYIADYSNHRIRKVDSSGKISTFAGTGTAGYSGDGGAATSAKLNYPYGVAVDSSGVLYIADYFNHRIRKVDSSGNISTIAGKGAQGYSGDGSAAINASLNSPTGVAVDSRRIVYIVDYLNNRIRKIDGSGNISTIAGTGAAGYLGDGGVATSAKLNAPIGVAVDSDGTVYIADYTNYRIRKVDSSGNISTFAGTGTYGYSGDGGAATRAVLNYPTGVAIDGSGTVYIADYYNNRIRQVTPAPEMSIKGNNVVIANDDTTPTTIDNTNFGSTPANTPVSQTFSITNVGSLALNLSGSPVVSLIGCNMFSVTTQPSSPIAAAGNSTFTVQYNPTAAGTHSCQVSIANDDPIIANPYVFTIKGTATILTQSILFNPASSATYGDAPITLNATSDSGLTVTFASTTSSVCTVSGTTLTIVGVGICTVTASQAGNSAYKAAAQVSTNITVSKKSITAQAEDKSRVVNTINPALTISYMGLANGDTIDTPPTVSTTATYSSSAGTYPITCNNASSTDDHYTITSCSNGTLTVTDIPVVVVPINYNLTVQMAGTGQGTIQGTAAGQYAAGTQIQLTASAESGSEFKGWTPADCANFAIAADTNCIATFDLIPPVVTPTNTSPVNYTILPDVLVTKGDAALTLNLANYFRDAEDAVLTYQVTSQDTNIATVQLNAEALTINFVNVGTSLIQITASDSQNAQVSAAFLVTVASKPIVPVPNPIETSICEPVENYQGVCNGRGKTLAITKIHAEGIIANFIIDKAVNNEGLISDVSLLATGKISGGKLSGTINNLGTIRDIEFVGKELSGSTLGGSILNSSPVLGRIHDVNFEPCAFVEGGYWGGVLTGDAQHPVYLNNLTLTGDAILNNVILGEGVRVTGNTQKWTNVKLAKEQPKNSYKWNGQISIENTACFAALSDTFALRPELSHRGKAVKILSLAIDKNNQHYSFNQTWLMIQPQIPEIKVAEQRTLPAALTFSSTLFQPLPVDTTALFLGYQLENGEIVYSGQLK